MMIVIVQRDPDFAGEVDERRRKQKKRDHEEHARSEDVLSSEIRTGEGEDDQDRGKEAAEDSVEHRAVDQPRPALQPGKIDLQATHWVSVFGQRIQVADAVENV